MRIFLGAIFVVGALIGCSQSDEDKNTSPSIVTCNQSYEDIGGYKLGCPLSNKEYFKLEGKDDKEKFATYSKQIDGFFDIVNIVTINGNVEAISFQRDENRKVYQSDIDEMLEALTKRWGEYSEQDKILSNMYTWNLDHEVIEQIIFSSSDVESPYPFFGVRYISKKIKDVQDKFEVDAEAARKQELSTY